jgi:DNA-binding CsgD family transcriptional regulator
MKSTLVLLLDCRATILWIGDPKLNNPQVIGTSIWEWHAEDEREQIRSAYARAITLGETQSFESTASWDGSPKRFHCRIEQSNTGDVAAVSQMNEVSHTDVGLTRRERQVLALLAQDCSTQQIAERLGIVASTVETHRTHLRKKLGVRSTAGLVRFAFEIGLIEGEI